MIKDYMLASQEQHRNEKDLETKQGRKWNALSIRPETT